MALWVAEDAWALFNAAALRVTRAINEESDTSLGDGRGAHRAGLECDVKAVAGEALAAGSGASGADRKDFGMGAGVAKFERAVAGGGYYAAIRRADCGTYWHFTARGGSAGFIKRARHAERGGEC